jgi:predicted Rossmann fold flavoprotein
MIENSKLKFDVAIVGAGPAGIMSAIISAQKGHNVVLIEKNNKIGKKFLLTGNGRCNLTNAEHDLKALVKNYNNGEFLFYAFSVFGPKKAINFFEKIGIKTVVEEKNRVFPKNNSSQKVLGALKKYLIDCKVKIIINSEVLDIICNNKKIEKLILKDREITANKYIFCTGGKSYPLTGSDGVSYKLLKKVGHIIVKPAPALTPIKLKENWIKKLQGISFKETNINIFFNEKKQFSEKGEFLFTHFGVSGPAILNISGKVGNLLEKGEVKMCFDLLPILNQKQIFDIFQEKIRKYPNKILKNILSEYVPERFTEIFLDVISLDKNKKSKNLTNKELEQIAGRLKNFEATPESILGFNEAMITQGGVSLKEINHKTMKSKIIENLYFAGEIIDIDAKTGGFNLQFCWSTGYLAGSA